MFCFHKGRLVMVAVPLV